MNQKKFILAIFAFLFISIGSSWSQKVGLVDINDVLANYPEYKTAQDELDRVAAGWRQQIAQEFDKVKSLYNKLQAEQVLLSPDDKMKKEEEIIRKEAEVRDMQKQKFGPEGELFLKRQELVAPIQEKVYSAIEAFASDRGYDIILDKGGSAAIIFANPEYDVTQDIKKRLNIK